MFHGGSLGPIAESPIEIQVKHAAFLAVVGKFACADRCGAGPLRKHSMETLRQAPLRNQLKNIKPH
jgi:hypothetical protein